MVVKQGKSFVGRAVDRFEREERRARFWRRVFFACWAAWWFGFGWLAANAIDKYLPAPAMEERG